MNHGTTSDPDWGNLAHPGHSVQFYRSDSELLASLHPFTANALASGDAAIIIATPDHRNALADLLERSGLDLIAATAEHRYVALDAAETLAKFMVGDSADAARFFELTGALIDTVAEPSLGMPRRRIATYGEMVRGIVVKTEPLEIDAWLKALCGALSAYAGSSARTLDALKRIAG